MRLRLQVKLIFTPNALGMRARDDVLQEIIRSRNPQLCAILTGILNPEMASSDGKEVIRRLRAETSRPPRQASPSLPKKPKR
jgi:hypothetical protein